MKKRQLITGMALALTLSTSALAAETVGIYDVATPTAQEIQQRYKELGLANIVTPAYVAAPDLDGLTYSGVLTDAVQQNALDTLNFVRYIAGLPDDVRLYDGFIQNAQDGALILAANDQLNHYPGKPYGMGDDLYNSGYLGTSGGNLGCGYDDFSQAIVHGWMSDHVGLDNLSALGHRRWILDPPMGFSGFGYISCPDNYYDDSYYTMYAIDRTGPSNAQGVVWPAQTMPVEYFGSDYPWSFSTDTIFYTYLDVTLTRQSDGRVWAMNTGVTSQNPGEYAIVNYHNYAQANCVIFRPGDVTYHPGDVFHVNMTDAYGETVADYTVTFMSLAGDVTPEVTTQPQVTPQPEVTTEPDVDIEVTVDDDTGATDLASPWFRDELAQGRKDGWSTDVFCETYQQDITRGEFVYLMGLYEQRLFEDVIYTNSHPFTDLDGFDRGRTPNLDFYVSYFYRYGVVGGTTDTTFSSDGNLTREQLATMLLRLARTNGDIVVTGDLSSYVDADDISPWAQEGMRYVNQVGALKGNDQNQLNPQGKVTIEQAQAILYRFYAAL